MPRNRIAPADGPNPAGLRPVLGPSAGGSADADAGDLEAADADTWARRLGDPRFQRQLALEVGLLAVAEGDVLALEQLDEALDETRVELLAGDPSQLLDSLVTGNGRAVGVARGHHVVGVGD